MKKKNYFWIGLFIGLLLGTSITYSVFEYSIGNTFYNIERNK